MWCAKLLLSHYLLFVISSYSFTFAVPVADDENYVDENETIPQLLPKCCPFGEALLEPKEGCTSSSTTFDPIYEGEKPNYVDVVIGFKCKYSMYRLEPKESSEDEFHLLPNGTLSTPFQEVTLHSPLEYCLDNTYVDNETEVLPFICFPPPTETKPSWKRMMPLLFPIGNIASVVFLIIVVLLHLGKSELRNTHGKILSCYSICLSFAFLSLSFVQLFGSELPYTFCVIMAFIIQFSFLTCFFWLNILCFHTWRIFNKGYTLCRETSTRDKVFMKYSVYGWGIPILFTVVSVVIDLAPAIPPSYLKPNFGLTSCWFESETKAAALPYFYGPVAIILLLNVIFFLLTARIIVRKENFDHFSSEDGFYFIVTNVMIVKKRRRKFLQTVILFMAMGLSWLMEIISWCVGEPAELWIVTDIINTLQGIIVFYVFVILEPKARGYLMHYIHSCYCCCTGGVQPGTESDNVHYNNDMKRKKTFKQMIPLVRLNKKKLQQNSTSAANEDVS